MSKKDNKKGQNDKFYLFKVDKDKIKLQLKDIGTKFIRPKSKKKGITILVSLFLLVGVGIAIHTNFYGSENGNSSNISIKSRVEKSDDSRKSQVEIRTEGNSLSLSDKKISLNQTNKNDSELNQSNRERNNNIVDSSPQINSGRENSGMKDVVAKSDNTKRKNDQVEGVVTKPVTPLEETDDSKIELLKPVSGKIIRKPGWYFHPVFEDWRYQSGIEINGDTGDIVMAADSGKVVSVKDDEYKGIVVKISHGENWSTVYGNLQKASVSPGEVVGKGQEVGRIGKTGITNKPSLYFELLTKDGPVNPSQYFN